MAGAVGLSSISGIEHLMADGSQMSRLESSEGAQPYGSYQKVNAHESNNPLLHQDHSNPALGPVLVESQIPVLPQQPQSAAQTARQTQSKNSGNPSKPTSGTKPVVQSQNLMPRMENTSSQHTTVLGSLTSNFQNQPAQMPKIKLNPQTNNNHQKLLNAQSSSAQSLKTVGQLNSQAYGGAGHGAGSGGQAQGGQQAAGHSRLIKINKSKKMLDTARRGRIQ